MRQLTGLDASFLYLEVPNAPMHVAGVVIYDPSTAPGGKVTFKQILAHVSSRMNRLPLMTSVVQKVPFGLDHPYWRADGNFDPEFHIRHLALPKPGDWRQLCIQIARLHSRQLDRRKPLWEMYVIEGLDNVEGLPEGCFAVYTKVHHAAIDGHSGQEMQAAIHDLSPEVAASPESFEAPRDDKPSMFELFYKAQLNNIREPFHFLNVAKNTLPAVGRMASGMVKGVYKPFVKVPRTRFNGNVSPNRTFDAVSFDFEDVRTIKNFLENVTVNDVALAICGGAMRKYLEAKDELPEHSMIAMAPINIRTEDKLGNAGNEVSAMSVKLCSDIEDPVERLKAVNEGTRNTKEMTKAIGAKTMMDYSQFIPSTLAASAAKLASSMGLANTGVRAFNTIVTNVPGPQVPIYFTGAKMLCAFQPGPVVDSIGLFHVISSYCGQFTISVTSCREIMPDPAFYTECVQASFDELLAATTKPNAKKKPRRKST